MNDGRNDFDFYAGTWKVHNRRLGERLKGSTSWEEFEGESVAQPILGGLGNIDEITLHRESGVGHGFTLRLFDPKTCHWYLYWTSSAISGRLDVPMIGRFENGRGEFFAQEFHEDQLIFSRYVWSNITENTCRWEQAFSPDGGKTWETNWIMESIRIK